MKIFMLPPTQNNPLWAGSPRPKGLRVPTSITPKPPSWYAVGPQHAGEEPGFV